MTYSPRRYSPSPIRGMPRRSRSPPPRRGYSPEYRDARGPYERERGSYGRPHYDYHQREPYYEDHRRGGYYRDEGFGGRPPYGGRPQYRDNYHRGGGGYHNHNNYTNQSQHVDPVELAETTDLFVGNLPPSFRERDLYQLFEKCGKVLNVTLGTNRRTRMSKCYAFVRYENRRDAEEAFSYFQEKTFEGRTLRIDWDIGQEKKAVRHQRIGGRPRYDDYGRGRSRSPSPGRGHQRIYGRGRSRTPSPLRKSQSRSPRYSSRSPPRRVNEDFEKRSRSPQDDTPESYKKPKLDRD